MAAVLTESLKEVRLILKKRPHHVTVVGFEKRKPQPRKELPKFSTGPKVHRSHGRRSRKSALKSSLEDLLSHASLDRYVYDN